MLPSVQNIYEIGCYIPADHFDDDITEENIGKKCLLILTTAIEAMKQYCGWIVPKVYSLYTNSKYNCHFILGSTS